MKNNFRKTSLKLGLLGLMVFGLCLFVTVSPEKADASTSAVLSSIYSNIVGGTDPYTLDQNNIAAYCNGNDFILSGAGTGPSCKNNSAACGIDMNYEYDSASPYNGHQGWTSAYSVQNNSTYDTTREEVVCVPNTSDTTRYFTTYTRTSGTVTDFYSLNQQKNVAYCDAGDLAIAGSGANVYCDKAGDGGCGKQMLEANKRIVEGNREGWGSYYSMPGDSYYDNVQTTVVCLKKTADFDSALRLYHRCNFSRTSAVINFKLLDRIAVT